VPRSITSVAVFCGSNFGDSDAYADGARKLGQALAGAGITLVYGGTTKR
jgi:predicted Rossmann-fold nucleotide-binding protein